MGDSREEKYISFLERLVRLTHFEPFDHESYKVLIREICEEYHLAKGASEFYRSPLFERRKDGEYFCDFDNGKGEKELLKLRICSSTKAVVIGTLYVEADDEERSQEEISQLDVMLRVILGFIARKRLIRKLEEYGFSDMSGYLNFRAFARYLDITNLENKLGGKVAFQMDIHNFTMVNQEIGRENGDIVLRNYYNLLKAAIGETGIIIRLGGDKFAGMFDRRVKRQVFDIFNGAPVPYDETGDKRISVSAAVGVYMLPDPFMMQVYGDVMDKILMAGNTAKRQTHGAIVIYDDKMKQEKNHIKKVQSDFKSALAAEEFAVFYQPKVDIETREIVGSEALCRWIKDGKIIPPMEFIPILEMNTDICDLDFYMLEHVCQHIRKWLDEGRNVVRVSVNLSRKHLVDVDLLNHIISVIDKYKVPHQYIEVELTETTTDVQFSDLKRVVCGLKEQGIWTAVDDFGVGYSSLNLIREIPWNVLKVDKSLVPRNDEDENNIDNLMFRHVVSLAQDMDLECVVEGVESVDQVGILKKNNCAIAQGYFFDKPLPLEDFEYRLDQKVYPEIYS